MPRDLTSSGVNMQESCEMALSKPAVEELSQMRLFVHQVGQKKYDIVVGLE